MIKRECKGDLKMKLPKDNQMNVYVRMWKNTVNEGYFGFQLGIRPLTMPMGPRRIDAGTEFKICICQLAFFKKTKNQQSRTVALKFIMHLN